MKPRDVVRTTGWVLLGLGAVAALGVLLVRDQVSRHRRDLFSPHPLRRLAALGFLGRRDASVEAIQLLRDFISWEPRPLLRWRAVQILERMERSVQTTPPPTGEAAG